VESDPTQIRISLLDKMELLEKTGPPLLRLLHKDKAMNVSYHISDACQLLVQC